MTATPLRILIATFGMGALPFGGVASVATAQGPSPDEAAKPHLYYILADISGSIISNRLETPIKGAMNRYLGEIPENAEVRIRVFDHELSGRSVFGPPFDAVQKGRAFDWINENFKPGRGNTLLFGSAGAVMQEILDDAQRFNRVQLIILTDGDDDPRDLAGRRIETPFAGWEDVSSISRQLKLATDQDRVAYLYTLNHEPKTTPPPDSGIVHDNIPDGRAGIVIDPEPPVVKPNAAFIVHPAQVKAGEPVLMFVDSDAGIESYHWTLSDGRDSREPRPQFTFSQPGSISVNLHVSGPGGEDTHPPEGEAVVVEVLEEPPPPKPRAEFTANPRATEAGTEILFAVESQAGIESYSWNFGDGSDPSSAAQPRHVYESEGLYTVTLEVSGPGGSASETKHGFVEVRDPQPSIPISAFSASPTKGRAPLTVRFTDESTGEIARWEWDFGDGNTSDLRNPEHTYPESDTYPVRLTVTNTAGESSVNSEVVEIVAVAPPQPLPQWAKGLLLLAAAFATWVLGVVPFFLTPFFSLAQKRGGVEYRIKPERGSATSMGQVYRAHRSTNWLWPRCHALIGSNSKDDVRLSTGGSATIAVIRRIPFKNRFRLVPRVPGAIKQRKESLRLGERAVSEIDLSGPTVLCNDEEFSFNTVNAKWEEKA